MRVFCQRPSRVRVRVRVRVRKGNLWGCTVKGHLGSGLGLGLGLEKGSGGRVPSNAIEV